MTDLTPAVRPTDLTPAGPGHRVLDLTALPGPFAVVHSLTTLIGVCPNRDRDQQPKTLVLGGAERMRISSQALIRAARTHLRTHTLHSAVHTRLLPAQTARRLQDKGIDTADAIPAAYAVVHGAGITMTPDDPTRTRAALSLPGTTADHLAALLLDHWDDLAGHRQAAETAITLALETRQAPRGRRTATPPRPTVPALPAPLLATAREAFAPHLSDIAVYGRMLAELPGGTVRSAISVAHGFGVDAAERVGDDFTGTDDWGTGGIFAVGILGQNPLISGTLYRYAALDRRQLRTNLAASGAGPGHVENRAQEAERAWATAMAYTLPAARSSRTGSTAPPVLVIAATTDHPYSAAAAFETPVDTPAAAEAAHRLTRYLTRLPLRAGVARWLPPTPHDPTPTLPAALAWDTTRGEGA